MRAIYFYGLALQRLHEPHGVSTETAVILTVSGVSVCEPLGLYPLFSQSGTPCGCRSGTAAPELPLTKEKVAFSSLLPCALVYRT